MFPYLNGRKNEKKKNCNKEDIWKFSFYKKLIKNVIFEVKAD